MRPLSYELLANCAMYWLDLRFNVVVCFGFRDDELHAFLQDPSLAETFYRMTRLPGARLLFSRNRKLTRIYKRLLQESYFLHFAGRQRDMALMT